jgi:hypothetical protein
MRRTCCGERSGVWRFFGMPRKSAAASRRRDAITEVLCHEVVHRAVVHDVGDAAGAVGVRLGGRRPLVVLVQPGAVRVDDP